MAARVLFGGRFPRLRPDEHYFDVTTVALRAVLRRGIAPASRVLDMGTGSAAVLGLWLWRRLRCRVRCSEVDPELVLQARESVRRNGAPIEVVRASFFEGVDGRFDHVVFNPPYVPTRVGSERGLPADDANIDRRVPLRTF